VVFQIFINIVNLFLSAQIACPTIAVEETGGVEVVCLTRVIGVVFLLAAFDSVDDEGYKVVRLYRSGLVCFEGTVNRFRTRSSFRKRHC
jgi:hypothetical protein